MADLREFRVDLACCWGRCFLKSFTGRDDSSCPRGRHGRLSNDKGCTSNDLGRLSNYLARFSTDQVLLSNELVRRSHDAGQLSKDKG